MYTIKYCQLCLVVDVRMFTMNTATLAAYSKLLQLPLHNKEPYICYECSALLLKYQQFHAKCLRAHNVLTHFKTQSAEVITHDSVEAQRKIYNLESKLSLTTVLHENINVQSAYSNNKVNVLSNIDSEEKFVHCKLNMLHVTNETKPLEYIDSASVYNNLTEFNLFEDTSEVKPIVTKDIQKYIELTDTSISDLDDEPLQNLLRSKNLVNTTKETNDEIDIKDENNDFTVKYFSCLEGDRNKDIDSKEDSTGFSDLLLGNLDEKLVLEIKNSKGLVEQATQIAQSVLRDKYMGMVANEESNTTNVDLDDKLFLNTGYSELVKTATRIAHQVRYNRFSCFKGFAKVVRLTKEMARNEVLLRKDTSNYRNSAYKCEICYIGFLGEVGCKNHMKKHSKERPAECEYCHIRFAKRRRMLQHVNMLHSYKIICMNCDYVTCSINEGRIHIDKHKGKTYPCQECGLSFSRQNSLFSHKQKTHGRGCVCQMCGDEFGTTCGLAIHKKLLHSQDSPAVSGARCEECALQFASEAAYARHRSLLHQRAASQDCEFCGETFSDYPPLRAHVSERHTPEKPRFCCLHCPFRFWDHKAYKSHLAAQHQRPRGSWQRRGARAGAGDGRRDGGRPVHTYVCEYCGKDVNIIQRLYHRLKHTGERPYKCKLCDKGFAHPTMRKIHMDTHATTRQYQCDKCPKNYKLKANLARHIRTVHSKIRPHACPVCGKMFPFPCELKLHVKYTHQNVPWPKRIRKPKAETHNY